MSSSPQANPDTDPPPYALDPSDATITESSNSDEPLSFSIGGERVYATQHPERTLYYLSQPVLKGKAAIIGIEKAIYRVKNNESPMNNTVDEKRATEPSPPKENTSDQDSPSKQSSVSTLPRALDEPLSMLHVSSPKSPFPSSAPRSLLDIGPTAPSSSQGPRLTHSRTHIYDIRPAWFDDVGKHILIVGIFKKAYSEGSLYKLPLTKTWHIRLEDDSWDCELGGSLMDKLKRKGFASDSYVWKGTKGKVLAVEKKEEIGDGDVVAGTEGDLTKPRLELRASMGEKEIDFLVTAWVARVAFEAMKAAKEPMSWEQFMKIATMKSKGKGPAFFAVV